VVLSYNGPKCMGQAVTILIATDFSPYMQIETTVLYWTNVLQRHVLADDK